ncbi:MAG: riboflavin kinase [bacterium]|nr:riboflavin kinase [bacterium]
MDMYIGIVEAGSKRAAALGYPTINIALTDESPSGVYAALVKVGEEEYEAVAFADQRRKLLEAHILDFSKDLYGWNVKIHLLKKVRENKKFTDDKSLHEAITGDVAAVRAYFMKKR